MDHFPEKYKDYAHNAECCLQLLDCRNNPIAAVGNSNSWFLSGANYVPGKVVTELALDSGLKQNHVQTIASICGCLYSST